MQGLRSFIILLQLWTLGVHCNDDSYRLPKIYSPEHYDLRILTHLNGSDQLHFEGEVKIDFRVLERTQNITLNAKNLTLDETRITLHSSRGQQCLSNFEVDEEKEFYIVHLCEYLQPDESYQLFMTFEAPLNANQTGYYWSSYNETWNNQTSYLAVTQFSPTFARLAFPCFDEPYLKATFGITLGYHSNYTGLTNTPVRSCSNHETLRNYVWCEHEQLLRTSTYLVAYAVHNMSSVATQSHGIFYRSWMQPKLLQDGNFLANFAPQVVNYLEKQFHLKFPLQKVDQLAVPTHKFSAMENWGLVTFKETRFVHNDSEDTQASKEQKAETMGHEYVHQWFGNMVTMNWWKDLWLKEGPSTYFAYLTLDALQPDWECSQRLIAKDLARFFRQDGINATIAISQEVQGSASILKQFSEYVYHKGSLTVRMLHKLLGDDAFWAGIRNYLQRHAYESVSQSDLWDDMQQAADAQDALPVDIRLATIMDSWTLQKGYPLVRVYRDYEAATVQISQTRFLVNHEPDQSSENCWWIPLRFVTQQLADFNETRPDSWLKCPSSRQELQLPLKTAADEWIILNPQVTTIHRVDYDERNWRMIIETLNSIEDYERIHVLNRAQLIDDLMALAGQDFRSYELAFSLLEYLPSESHPLPWTRALEVLHRQGNLLHGEKLEQFKLYMRKLILPLYKRCPTLNSIASPISFSSQTLSLYRLGYEQACRYNLGDCISDAMALDEDKIPVDLRDIVYCTRIAQGDESTFQAMMQRFENSKRESEKQVWATALGCCRNSSHLQQFLDYLLLSSSRSSLSSFYLDAATSALQQRYVALETSEHILQHAARINEKLNARNIKVLLLAMINYQPNLKSHEFRGLEKFRDSLDMALEMRDNNEIWLQQRSDAFIAALKKYI